MVAFKYRLVDVIRWLRWRVCYAVVWYKILPSAVYIAWRLVFVWHVTDPELLMSMAKAHYPKEMRKMRAAARLLIRKFPECYY